MTNEEAIEVLDKAYPSRTFYSSRKVWSRIRVIKYISNNPYVSLRQLKIEFPYFSKGTFKILLKAMR